MKNKRELKKLAERFARLEERVENGDKTAIKEINELSSKLTPQEMFLLDDIIAEKLTNK